jgi:hypothetical protein
MRLWQVVKENRIAKWAAIAFAVNAFLCITGPLFDQLFRPRTAHLILPPSDVAPMCDPSTKKLKSYYVAVPVEEVLPYPRSFGYRQQYELFGVNIALFAWLFSIAAKQHKREADWTPIEAISRPRREEST